MTELFTLILGIVGIFVVLSGASYFLEPSAMKKNGFFTTPPVLTVKIVAFLVGLLFLFVYVMEFLTSTSVHIIPPILAAALFIYTFGAERLLLAWENRKKK
jgi:hypothetical protein